MYKIIQIEIKILSKTKRVHYFLNGLKKNAIPNIL